MSFMTEHWQLVCHRGAWMFLEIREGLGDRLYPALGFAVGILTGVQILLAKLTQVGG